MKKCVSWSPSCSLLDTIWHTEVNKPNIRVLLLLITYYIPLLNLALVFGVSSDNGATKHDSPYALWICHLMTFIGYFYFKYRCGIERCAFILNNSLGRRRSFNVEHFIKLLHSAQTFISLTFLEIFQSQSCGGKRGGVKRERSEGHNTQSCNIIALHSLYYFPILLKKCSHQTTGICCLLGYSHKDFQDPVLQEPCKVTNNENLQDHNQCNEELVRQYLPAGSILQWLVINFICCDETSSLPMHFRGEVSNTDKG